MVGDAPLTSPERHESELFVTPANINQFHARNWLRIYYGGLIVMYFGSYIEMYDGVVSL